MDTLNAFQPESLDRLPEKAVVERLRTLPLSDLLLYARQTERHQELARHQEVWKSRFHHFFPDKYAEYQLHSHLDWYNLFAETYRITFSSLNNFQKIIVSAVIERDLSTIDRVFTAELAHNLHTTSQFQVINSLWKALHYLHRKQIRISQDIGDFIYKTIDDLYRNIAENEHIPVKDIMDLWYFSGPTALAWCIFCHQSLNKMLSLLEEKPLQMKDYLDPNHYRAIHLATIAGDIDFINIILDRDLTEITSLTGSGDTALTLAIQNNRKNIVTMLLLRAPTLSQQTGRNSPLNTAIKSGNHQMVKLLYSRTNHQITEDHVIIAEQHHQQEIKALLIKQLLVQGIQNLNQPINENSTYNQYPADIKDAILELTDANTVLRVLRADIMKWKPNPQNKLAPTTEESTNQSISNLLLNMPWVQSHLKYLVNSNPKNMILMIRVLDQQHVLSKNIDFVKELITLSERPHHFLSRLFLQKSASQSAANDAWQHFTAEHPAPAKKITRAQNAVNYRAAKASGSRG